MISLLKSRVLFFIIFAMKQLTEVLYLKKILVLCYRRFFFFFWWNVESNIKVAKIFLFMLGRYSGRGLFFLMLKFYLPRSYLYQTILSSGVQLIFFFFLI